MHFYILSSLQYLGLLWNQLNIFQDAHKFLAGISPCNPVLLYWIDCILLSLFRRLLRISASAGSFCSRSSWWFSCILIVSCWRLCVNNKWQQYLQKSLTFGQSTDVPTEHTIKLIHLSYIFWATMTFITSSVFFLCSKVLYASIVLGNSVLLIVTTFFLFVKYKRRHLTIQFYIVYQIAKFCFWATDSSFPNHHLTFPKPFTQRH